MSDDRLLLVEGEDDQHVVEQLCKRCGIPVNFRIRETKGYPKLRQAIADEVKVSGRLVVGIVADADDDPRMRWQEIAAELSTSELSEIGVGTVPRSPNPTGTLIEGKLRVGVWLMPNNRGAGELEDFVQGLIPSADRVWPLAKKYIADIPPPDRRFKRGKISKAEVYAWLAVREQPHRMGAAIGAGDLDTNAARAIEFTQWLRVLFRDDTAPR